MNLPARIEVPLISKMVVVVRVPVDKALNIEELRADGWGRWSNTRRLPRLIYLQVNRAQIDI
jgi:hypothetical protein